VEGGDEEPGLKKVGPTGVGGQPQGNISVDWMHREAARARMRVLVKRLLRKCGYPPDLQDAAVQNVLQQAEALSADWAA
jgi:type I restriction enzyme R subunit